MENIEKAFIEAQKKYLTGLRTQANDNKALRRTMYSLFILLNILDWAPHFELGEVEQQKIIDAMYKLVKLNPFLCAVLQSYDIYTNVNISNNHKLWYQPKFDLEVIEATSEDVTEQTADKQQYYKQTRKR